jgi:hypothetical protein
MAAREMSNVTHVEFDRRSKALRALEKLDTWPAFDEAENTAGEYILWANDKTLHVLLSDGTRWHSVACFVAESVARHMTNAAYLRRRQRDEIKRAECQHDYKGKFRKHPGPNCVKCREPRPKKWVACGARNTKCPPGYWSHEICAYKDRHCRRRKGHTGDCSWGGRPADLADGNVVELVGGG